MRQLLRFLLALCVAVILVIGVRMFAFTVYASPVTIGSGVHKGSKVVVNKLCRNENFEKGEYIIFTVSGEAPQFAVVEPPQQIGMVVAVPGDTITVEKQRYRIPYICCDRCQCSNCRLYLVDTGGSHRLVHKHQVVGKVY